MKITPSARILRMLGEIEFAEWQCVAELVDNAFDDFAQVIDEGVSWPGGHKVSVTLPGPGTAPRDAEVIVKDTGRGMTRAHLEQAVRAGWSSNDQFDKLGLFGMGFNVSTARLGRKTRVLTTQMGDTHWIGVEIDLDNIGDDFEAPDITMPKEDPSEHGTRIEISKLDPDRASWLTRNAPALRRQLGHVYGWLLDHKPFELWVGGVRVKAHRPCHWSAERSVNYGSGKNLEQIPAFIQIDQTYEPAETCLVCGNWQTLGLEECKQCGSQELRARERRIHGWLGVQRYLDRSDFGIDFLRNGRKILTSDKRLFEWSNPNDPTAAQLVEYPAELGQGGRLIGEIHLDHVPVNYQKNAFEFSDRGWLAAVSYLRGEGPLLPQKAKSLGYMDNDSTLGRLFKGYRRNDAGLRYLVPGDGKGPIHDKTREWGRKFHDGIAEYQTDETWWLAVLQHETVKNAAVDKQAVGTGTAHADEASVLAALGIGTATGTLNEEPSTQDPAVVVAETESQRLARYQQEGVLLPDLCGDFGSADLNFLKLSTWSLDPGPVEDAAGNRTPVWISLGAGNTANAFVDASHQMHTRFAWEPAETLLTELAVILKARADSPRSITEIVQLVQANCLPDSALDVTQVAAQARELLNDVRQRMADAVVDEPARAFQWLGPDEVVQTENSMISDGARGVGPLEADSRFVMYTPSLYLVQLLEEWPEAFLDGSVFTEPYESLGSLAAKRLSLSRVASLLADVAALSFLTNPGRLRLARGRLSILLLSDELAAGG